MWTQAACYVWMEACANYYLRSDSTNTNRPRQHISRKHLAVRLLKRYINKEIVWNPGAPVLPSALLLTTSRDTRDRTVSKEWEPASEVDGKKKSCGLSAVLSYMSRSWRNSVTRQKKKKEERKKSGSEISTPCCMNMCTRGLRGRRDRDSFRLHCVQLLNGLWCHQDSAGSAIHSVG